MILASVGLARTAVGQTGPVGQGSQGSARDLGAEALALFDRGEYAKALERFDMANGLMPAPTLGIRSARCLVKLGRLVEASGRYLEVTRFPLTERSLPAHVQAVQQARAELDALQASIPTLEIAIPGRELSEIAAKLDGAELPGALLGQPQPLDPGEHRLQIRGSELSFDAPIALKEGDKVKLLFPAPPKPPAPPSAQAGARPSSPVKISGFVALGVGAAGALMGVVSGALAVTEQDALEASCPDRNCPPEQHAAADRYDVTRVLTTIGLVTGGVGLTLGTILVLADPGEDAEAPAAARPAQVVTVDAWLAWNGIGLRCTF